MAAFVVAGVGAVGARAARQVLSGGTDRLAIVGTGPKRVEEVVGALGSPARASTWEAAMSAEPAAVVLAGSGDHTALASEALSAGAHVVSVSDDPDTAKALLALDGAARGAGRTIAVGVGFSPGMSCLLARHAARAFDVVDEIHVAAFGTGGPACAWRHHRSLASGACEWVGGRWQHRPGGTGRQLCWFPDPVSARDCYRAAVPEPLLLQPAFPTAGRISARRAATRRDRLTEHLPMLRRPHAEGLLGAVRVEVVGRSGDASRLSVLGALDRPAVAAGVVAGLSAHWAVEGLFTRTGAGGLAALVDQSGAFLRQLAERGVRAAVFAESSG